LWRVTPVLFSHAFSLLIKYVRQREVSFYGGRAKYFVVASVGKKKIGLLVKGILISILNGNDEVTEGIEIKK
jgi:hypothetical protein